MKSKTVADYSERFSSSSLGCAYISGIDCLNYNLQRKTKQASII